MGVSNPVRVQNPDGVIRRYTAFYFTIDSSSSYESGRSNRVDNLAESEGPARVYKLKATSFVMSYSFTS
ncbi:MAG: hypothetical protein HXX16_08930 [Bacteroidales bacterium]|nr:hypothetical protein [Bacteroidales bacterium]